MAYNYNKLRGKIREVFVTEGDFCNAFKGIGRTTLSERLNGKSDWTQTEMRTAMDLLHIPYEEVNLYFFCPLGTETRTKAEEA